MMDKTKADAVIAKYTKFRDMQSRHLHHHFEGSGPYVAIELLDAIEARNAEMEAMKAIAAVDLTNIRDNSLNPAHTMTKQELEERLEACHRGALRSLRSINRKQQ